jgi:hypothetical protein
MTILMSNRSRRAVPTCETSDEQVSGSVLVAGALITTTIWSALGHERRSRTARDKSGLPLTADIRGISSLFGSGPFPDSCIAAKQTLFDHFVRAGEHDVGRSRPSALAVFRLTTSSYLVGICTGRSAGFAPALISAIMGHAGAAPNVSVLFVQSSDEVAGRSSPAPRPQSNRTPNARAA